MKCKYSAGGQTLIARRALLAHGLAVETVIFSRQLNSSNFCGIYVDGNPLTIRSLDERGLPIRLQADRPSPLLTLAFELGNESGDGDFQSHFDTV